MKNIEGQIEVLISDLLYIGAKREEGNADTLKRPGNTEKNNFLILNSSKRSTFPSQNLFYIKRNSQKMISPYV